MWVMSTKEALAFCTLVTIMVMLAWVVAGG
jgi:hypothetical protein